ncbi:MAG: malonyl-CoA decarboxylase [Pseudomonadota bacterium]
MQFLQRLVPGIQLSRWTPAVLRKHLSNEETESIDTLAAMMMDSDGEYSSLVLAERILNAFEKLDDAGRLRFFELLHVEYDIDIAGIKTSVEAYERSADATNLLRITKASEPRRQELLRRINLTADGTRRLVKMRESLLKFAREKPELKKIDTDFHHLFNAWFNRGFLLMEPIDWTTPAHILEKIIAYEAVHEIRNWSELRSRLEPSDRYCYGFFHPSMEAEPLVFVEVALTTDIPSGIGEILHRDGNTVDPDNASCAIFYSISACHQGLGGVSFGNFLIKQVATSLQMRFPQLKTFSTISPVPGFRKWLENQAENSEDLTKLINDFTIEASQSERETLEKLAAQYFLEAKSGNGQPLDPVARFHLKNGAILERINVLGDPSEKGMKQSFGTMVNYVYNLARVEENHEEFVKNNRVVSSSSVKKALDR